MRPRKRIEYRLLEIGETIKEGDVVNMYGRWVRMAAVHIGNPINRRLKCPYPHGYYATLVSKNFDAVETFVIDSVSETC